MTELLKAIAVTAELMGTEWSKDAARMIAEELSVYPLESVKQALSRCRKELKGRLTLTDILDRVPGGHPGPEEAWSLVSRALANEAVTIIWTDEVRSAYGVAANLADDPVAARMAFKETYTKLLSESRSAGRQPKWSVSLGHDAGGRESVVMEAVEKGRLSFDHARHLCPRLLDPHPSVLALTKRIR